MNQPLEEDSPFVRKWGFPTEVTLSVQRQTLRLRTKQWCPQSMPWDCGAEGSNRAAAPASPVGPTQPLRWQTPNMRISRTVKAVSPLFKCHFAATQPVACSSSPPSFSLPSQLLLLLGVSAQSNSRNALGSCYFKNVFPWGKRGGESFLDLA